MTLKSVKRYRHGPNKLSELNRDFHQRIKDNRRRDRNDTLNNVAIMCPCNQCYTIHYSHSMHILLTEVSASI